MPLLIGQDITLLKVGKMSTFLTVGWNSPPIGWNSPPIPKVSHKGSGEWGQSTTGGSNSY